VIPALEAADTEAPRVKWALKTEMSAPASSRVILSHLAIEFNVTALCGLIKETNSLVSSPRNALVFSRLVLSNCTGHNLEFPGKEREEKNPHWVYFGVIILRGLFR